MPSDSLKSTFDVGAGAVSPTTGAGRNNGPMGNDNTDAQFIKTVEFRELQARSANVDGSFRDGMKPDLSGTTPAQPSARPASEVFSSFECGHDKVGTKRTGSGGGVKSSMGY